MSAADYGPLGREVRPYWKPILQWGTLLMLLAIGGLLLSFAFGWLGAAKQVVSPANVRAQYATAYSRYEALKATTCNVAALSAQVATTTDAGVKAQLSSQETALQQNYTRIAADYDAAYDNAFAAKHVGPSDLPRVAPTLSESLATASC